MESGLKIDSKDGIQGPYHSSVSDQDHPQLTVVKWRDLCQMVGQCWGSAMTLAFTSD